MSAAARSENQTKKRWVFKHNAWQWHYSISGNLHLICSGQRNLICFWQRKQLSFTSNFSKQTKRQNILLTSSPLSFFTTCLAVKNPVLATASHRVWKWRQKQRKTWKNCKSMETLGWCQQKLDKSCAGTLHTEHNELHLTAGLSSPLHRTMQRYRARSNVKLTTPDTCSSSSSIILRQPYQGSDHKRK